MPSSNEPRETLRQLEEVSQEVLDDARASLMMSVRFMDVALWRMPFYPRYLNLPLATDGRFLFFDALAVVDAYQQDRPQVARTYLHTVLHCVFRHAFAPAPDATGLWDIACDIAVEATCMELLGLRLVTDGDSDRLAALKEIRTSCPKLTAKHVYDYLVERVDRMLARNMNADAEKLLARWSQLFARDDHTPWPRREEPLAVRLKVDDKTKVCKSSVELAVKGSPEEELQDDQDPNTQGGDNLPGAPAPSTGGMAYEGQVENGDRFLDIEATEKAQEEFLSLAGVEAGPFEGLTWKDISEKISMELEAFEGKIGSNTGTFEVNLHVATRKAYDYRDFLKRFSSLSEEMKVSVDEFDYIYYTYGLEHYDNMPLIEPLEYQESNRVREFVIAIDTSASCAGNLVKRFVEKTYDILKSTSGFGRKLNVHVIQCDCDIRKDTVITELADIDDDFASFKARGFGGTDFRPVFRYVNDLIEERKLTKLKGLIYLTDGFGKYPVEPPGYDTVFVFLDDSGRQRKVPPWAMKVVMTEDQIVEL